MYIFLAILIPVFSTLGFWIWKPHEFAKWELIFPTAVTIVVIFIAKFSTQYAHTHFTEYWGETVTAIYEAEPWNEWIVETCEDCTTDSDGNETCISYDCSYQEDYAPKWYAETNLGSSFYMSESQHDEIRKQWGVEHRDVVNTHHSDFPNDRAVGASGTKFEGPVGRVSHTYKTTWNNVEETRRGYTSKHSYVNKIKASDLSIFNISVVTEEEADSLGLFKYPKVKDGLEYPTILGEALPRDIEQAYQRLNAKFGPTNQLRLWVLVYHNAPRVVGSYQENYWVNGNKNELVVCISVDDLGMVQWAHSFSWALSQDLVVETRNAALNVGVFNQNGWNNYYGWLNKNLHRFERREFAEFDYIKVEPATWAVWLVIILSIVFSIGTNLYAINNDYDKDGPKYGGSTYYNHRRFR